LLAKPTSRFPEKVQADLKFLELYNTRYGYISYYEDKDAYFSQPSEQLAHHISEIFAEKMYPTPDVKK